MSSVIPWMRLASEGIGRSGFTRVTYVLRPGVDEGHRGDLDDVVSTRIEPSRLEVERHESLVQEGLDAPVIERRASGADARDAESHVGRPPSRRHEVGGKTLTDLRLDGGDRPERIAHQDGVGAGEPARSDVVVRRLAARQAVQLADEPKPHEMLVRVDDLACRRLVDEAARGGGWKRSIVFVWPSESARS